MTLSIREQVLRAVVAALEEKEYPAQGGVFRSRLDQIEPAQLPCFDVSPGEEKLGEEDHAGVERTLQIAVRAMIDASIQGGAGGEPEVGATDDGGLDPFYLYAVRQLTGGASNLGGLVEDFTEVGNKTVFRPGGRNIIGLEMNFEAKFTTKRGDPARGA